MKIKWDFLINANCHKTSSFVSIHSLKSDDMLRYMVDKKCEDTT